MNSATHCPESPPNSSLRQPPGQNCSPWWKTPWAYALFLILGITGVFGLVRWRVRYLEKRAQGFKSSLLHVRKADVADQLVPVPPASEQRAIATRCSFIAEMQEIEP